jgi:hypothetical protein
LIGIHHGYERIGVKVERQITLRKLSGILEIVDRLSGEGDHDVVIPIHLAPGVEYRLQEASVCLHSMGQSFDVSWEGANWQLAAEPSTVSPSYGVRLPTHRLAWRRIGSLPADLKVTIVPATKAQRSCDR